MTKPSYFFLCIILVNFININVHGTLDYEEYYKNHVKKNKRLVGFLKDKLLINVQSPNGKLINCIAMQHNIKRDNTENFYYEILTNDLFDYKGNMDNCTFEIPRLYKDHFTNWLIRTNYTDPQTNDWNIVDNLFTIYNQLTINQTDAINEYMKDEIENTIDLYNYDIEKINETKIINNYKIGSKIILNSTKIEKKINNCYAVRIKNNKNIIIDKITNETIWKLFDDINNETESSCSMIISNIEIDLIGYFMIVTHFNEFKLLWDIFEINGTKNIQPRPSDLISMENNKNVNVFIQYEFNDNDDCKIYHNNKLIKGYKWNTTFEDEDDIKNCNIQDICCFKIFVNNNTIGSWFIEKKNKHLTINGDIELRNINYTNDVDDNSNKMNYKLWNEGSIGEITMDSYENYLCQLHQLYNSDILLKSFECKYRVENVTMSDVGNFLAYYYVGYPNWYIKENYIIEIKDKNGVIVGVNETENLINILCRGPLKKDMIKCEFKKFDNTIITFPSVINNNKYNYFGIGFKNLSNDQFPECGLTINNPLDDDYKKWICYLQYDDNNYTTDVFIHKNNYDTKAVDLYDDDDDEENQDKYIYVKRGTNFKIKCQIKIKINYCQIQSPNGTYYQVNNEIKTSNSLQYFGDGYDNGDCGVIIENANHQDNGNWTCVYRIGEKSKLKKIISIIVRDITVNITIDESSSKNYTKLKCHVYPVDEEIAYCQWQHPNQKYIYTDDEKYSIDIKNFTIKFPYQNKDDIGQWKCVVRLNGSDNNLYEAIYDLKTEQHDEPIDEQFSFLIFFIILGFFVFLLMLLILLICLYRSETCTPSSHDTKNQVE